MPTREDQAHDRPDPAGHPWARPSASCPAAAPSWAPSPPTPSRRRSPGTAAEFGKGAIEGVAAPEAANNAGAQMSFVPMLTLGIPSNAMMALMIGAMIIQGIQPGPSVMKEQPALVWGVIVSMSIGNLFLVVLNLPLIGLWVRMIWCPPALVSGDPGVLRHRGVQPEQQRVRHLPHGAVRAARLRVREAGLESTTMLLAFILGPLMEEYLRRAMLISRGNPWVFVQRPISTTLLALAVLAMCAVLVPVFGRTREEAFTEGAS